MECEEERVLDLQIWEMNSRKPEGRGVKRDVSNHLTEYICKDLPSLENLQIKQNLQVKLN